MSEMSLDKHIVEVQKDSNGTKRLPVNSIADGIKLAAVMQPVDLVGQYGIPKSLVEGMDTSSADPYLLKSFMNFWE